MGYSFDDNPISNAANGSSLGNYGYNQTMGIGRSVANDPLSAGRTLQTGGLSNAYGQWQKPDKEAQAKAQQAYQDSVNNQNTMNQGIAGQMAGAGSDYYNTVKGAMGAYQGSRGVADQNFSKFNSEWKQRSQNLMREASQQAIDAGATYNQNIKPSLMNLMEDAQTQAKGAMSLKDAGDMNNSVQQGVRQFYENQASGENKQGLANVGVMSALGAQALKGQLGSSMPMTGGQISALQGQNMAQAGQAYAQTQQRIQALRDQGLAQGIAQSNAQYMRGQQAKQFAMDTANNLQSADQSFLGSQQQARAGVNALSGQIYGSDMADVNRQYGNAAEDYGMQSNLGGIGYQNAVNAGNMQMGIGAQFYNQQRGMAAGDLAAANASLQAKNNMLGGVLSTAGTVAGGMAAGPGGAAAGQSIGGLAGQGAGAGANYPQYGGGGYGANNYAGGGGQSYGSINPMMFQKDQNGNFVNWQTR